MAAERVALNYLGHLSGIASKTAGLVVSLVSHTKAQICDTRKTTPGLRAAEKYAVRAGGGANHRFGLDDAILIKDNHIAVAGGITAALSAAQEAAGHMLAIEIEVDTLAQMDEALEAGAKIILLDNMEPVQLADAVARSSGRAVLEASGRINEETVVAIAESGVDFHLRRCHHPFGQDFGFRPRYRYFLKIGGAPVGIENMPPDFASLIMSRFQ